MSELFEKFEVNRDSRWTVVLLRLLGASLVLHLVLVWMVVYVPAVRDTVNIAALIATTKWVDKDYVATQIGDEVQIVELQKFRYPDGYFALGAQLDAQQTAQAQAANAAFAPKIISQWNPKTPDPEASPSPSPAASPSPGASPAASASPSAVAQASPSPADVNANANTQLSPEESQKKLEETAKENNLSLPAESEINKKVLKDFANYANDLKNQGKLDLNKPFEIVIEAEMGADGKLHKPRVTKKSGDDNLIDLFRQMIAALNDSGFLIYLKQISQDKPGAKVVITVKQGESEVLASVESETASSADATRLAKVLNMGLAFGAGSRKGKDEEVLMRNTTATPDGNKVVVNFSMPRQSVVDMIKKQLEPGV